MKKFLLYAIMFSVCIGLCACGKTEQREYEESETPVVIPEEDMRGNPDEGVDEDTADISTDGCFIIHTVGSREMTAYDLQDEQSSIYTYDLDDLALGEWKSTKTFDMCHYRLYRFKATSPENWYLIKPTADDYEITFTGRPYAVTYNNTEYRESDYEDSERYGGYFVLTPNGIERRATQIDEYDTTAILNIPEGIEYQNQILITVKDGTGFWVYDGQGEKVIVESNVESDTDDNGDDTMPIPDLPSVDFLGVHPIAESENGSLALYSGYASEEYEGCTTYSVILTNDWTDDTAIFVRRNNFLTDGIVSVKCVYGEVGISEYESASFVQMTNKGVEWVEIPVLTIEPVIESEQP